MTPQQIEIALDRLLPRVAKPGRYTGGQPVRLALYSDMLIEGGVPPQPLQDTWAEAQARVGIHLAGGEVDEDTLTPEQTQKLAVTRKVIEGDPGQPHIKLKGP